MIYTIGHKESYDLGFKQFKNKPKEFKKMGKRDDYIGGSVFLTYESAILFLKTNNIDNFNVYGVLADWETQTEFNEHDQFNNLLIDAQLIKLD